jgi:hypothetical protein
VDIFGGRSAIIGKVTSPWALLALIFLAGEAILLFLARSATGWDFSALIWGTFIILIIALGVTLVAVRQTGAPATSIAVAPPTPFLSNPPPVHQSTQPAVMAVVGLWEGYLTLVIDRKTEIYCQLFVALHSDNKISGVLRYEGKRDGKRIYQGADVLRGGSEKTCTEGSWKPHFDRWCHHPGNPKHIQVSRVYAWECTIANGAMKVSIDADPSEPGAEFTGNLVKQ